MSKRDETVSSKDALFMLDTDMEQEMKSYSEEVTLLTIRYINSTPELYNRVKNSSSIEKEARKWANEHDKEFGPLFVSELDVVDWQKVGRMV